MWPHLHVIHTKLIHCEKSDREKCDQKYLDYRDFLESVEKRTLPWTADYGAGVTSSTRQESTHEQTLVPTRRLRARSRPIYRDLYVNPRVNPVIPVGSKTPWNFILYVYMQDICNILCIIEIIFLKILAEMFIRNKTQLLFKVLHEFMLSYKVLYWHKLSGQDVYEKCYQNPYILNFNPCIPLQRWSVFDLRKNIA